MELNPPRLTIFAPALIAQAARPSNAGDVLVYVGSFQTVGRNERVDVKAAGLRADDRSDVDVADCSRRNPWKGCP